MNILAVLTYLTRNAGGMYESVRELHKATAKLPGVEAFACGVEDEFIDADLPGWAPVPVKAFKIYGPRQLQYAPGMRRYLFETDVDVIHTHGIWTYPSVVVSAWHRKYRRPYLISPHGMLDPWAVKNSAWKKRLASAFYQQAHLKNAGCLRALCESEASAMRQFGLKNPICVIPNGMKLPTLSDRAPVRGSGSPFHAMARGRKVLLYLGRLHPKKNLVNLLRAWKNALDSQPAMTDSWILAIAGWDQGGYESHLRQVSAESGLDHSVYFLGPQFNEAKVACYRDCDAFVLPSLSEGLPMVILEAWSYGKPVLMTAECNLPEGFAAHAALPIQNDVESISQGLKDLFEMSENERQEMGGRGLVLVQDRFVWPRIALQMQDVYDWLLGAGPQPECLLNG